jgi:GNAT superfamily N-acetyltransferase
MAFSVECLRPPLPAEVTEELMALWVLPEVFGDGNVGDDGVKVVRSMLTEAGEPENQQLVYTARDGEGGALAGTAVLCASRDPAAFGSLGEVATHPHFRRRGVAEMLCARSREDFRAMGGEMLVLGTMTPNAARVYRRTGYRRLPGTNVWWMNAKDGRSPEEWQVDHFRPAPQVAAVAGGGVAISEGSARERLRMLALLHVPHDALVLDATLEIYSTRAAVQCSVNGLYPRYAALVDARYDNSDGVGSTHDRGLRGCWWAMHSSGGTLVGLATAAASVEGSEDVGVAWVDGFTHARWFEAHWPALLAAAIGWAREARKFNCCRARVAASDAPKLAAFEALGFSRAGGAEPPPFVFGVTDAEGGSYLGPALTERCVLMELPLQATEKL